MAQPLPKPWSVADFLAWEREQEDRYEFVDGMIRAMVGGTVDHAAIMLNVAASLKAQLAGGRCRVFAEALKV